MNQKPLLTAQERSMLLRAVYMALMVFACQLAGTALFVVALIQFALALLTGTPNARLLAFGSSLGSYLRQVARFLTFASEEVPFPFSDWPAGE